MVEPYETVAAISWHMVLSLCFLGEQIKAEIGVGTSLSPFSISKRPIIERLFLIWSSKTMLVVTTLKVTRDWATSLKSTELKFNFHIHLCNGMNKLELDKQIGLYILLMVERDLWVHLDWILVYITLWTKDTLPRLHSFKIETCFEQNPIKIVRKQPGSLHANEILSAQQ